MVPGTLGRVVGGCSFLIRSNTGALRFDLMTEIPRLAGQWQQVQSPGPVTFVCGHAGCGRVVASERGWYTNTNPGGRVYVCPLCNRPTYLDDKVGVQLPAPTIGREVAGLPEDVALVYHEARAAYTAGAHTAAILTARKLLMHIAVAKGAKAGESFLSYAQYLVTNHWTPPGSEVWV